MSPAADTSGADDPTPQEPFDGDAVPSAVSTPADDPLAALGGAGGGFDLGSMVQMAQDMTARMGEAQSRLGEARVEGSAGGGLVRLTLDGHLHLRAVSIDPGAYDPEDSTVLEDLLLAAWSDAHDQVARLQAESDPLGGLGGLGGLGDLLGGG